MKGEPPFSCCASPQTAGARGPLRGRGRGGGGRGRGPGTGTGGGAGLGPHTGDGPGEGEKMGGGGEEGQKTEGRGSWCRRHCWEGAERGAGMFPEPSCSCGAEPCVCSNVRSPRRHRSSSSSPPRLKERRDEEKKEIKDSKGKERQITGKKAGFWCVSSPLALLDCGQHRNILYSWLILMAAGGEL